MGEYWRIMNGREYDAFNRDTADKRDHDTHEEGHPIIGAPINQLPGNEGREHGHFALGKVKVIDRLINHHHRQGDAGINRARR